MQKNKLKISDVADMILNRKEYQISGGAGERFSYRELLKIGIPENQISQFMGFGSFLTFLVNLFL